MCCDGVAISLQGQKSSGYLHSQVQSPREKSKLARQTGVPAMQLDYKVTGLDGIGRGCVWRAAILKAGAWGLAQAPSGQGKECK